MAPPSCGLLVANTKKPQGLEPFNFQLRMAHRLLNNEAGEQLRLGKPLAALAVREVGQHIPGRSQRHACHGERTVAGSHGPLSNSF